MASVRVTYYLEVLSSWCHWAEPTWAEIKRRYAGIVECEWQIALMQPEAFPKSREQCDWFYRRSGTVRRSPYMLNSGWFEPGQGQFLAPNLMALAAKKLGGQDDSVRLALTHAAVRDGKKVARWEVAAEVASQATGIFPQELLALAQSAEILAEAKASTEVFEMLQILQRPAFVIENSLGDKAIFSGLVQLAPLVATIEAMREDETGYASHEAHFGPYLGQ